MTHTPITLLVPVLPNDSSCANLYHAHINLSNLWFLATCLYAEAGMIEKANKCFLMAKGHGYLSQMHLEIAELGFFMSHILAGES